MNVIEVKDVSFQSSAFSINNLSFSIPQGFVTDSLGLMGQENNDNSYDNGYYRT